MNLKEELRLVYQTRARAEREDLSTKIEKLEAFIRSGDGVSEQFLNLTSDEQFRLRLQLQVMSMYLDILDERIEHFK